MLRQSIQQNERLTWKKFYVSYLVVITLFVSSTTNAAPSVLTVSGPDNVCPGSTYTYTAKTLALVNCNFTWSVIASNGTVLRRVEYTKNNPFTFPVAVAPQAGTIVFVRCVLQYGLGCPFTYITERAVRVAPAPGPIAGPTSMVFGAIGNFTTTATCGGPGAQLRWTVPAGWLVNGQPGPLITTANSVSIQAPASGAGGYTITVQTFYPNNLTAGFPQTTVVGLNQFLPLTLTITGTEYVSPNQPNTWTANVSGGTGFYSYQWQYNTTGQWIMDYSNQPTFTYTLINQSEIRLRLTVTSGSASAYDEHAAYCAQCRPSFSSYPNPADGLVTIDNPQGELLNVELYNDQGNRVKKLENLETTTSFETRELPKGRYTLKIITKDGITTQHILINN